MNNSRELEMRQRIDAYIKGQLGEEEIQDLWNDIAKNPELLEVLELEVNVKALIERKAQTAPTKARINKLPTWTWRAAAAAVIVIIALIQLFRIDTPPGLDQLVVQKINLSEIETANGVRAKDLRITPADSLLNLGFEAAISGNEERALKLFSEVINNFDEEPYGSKAFLNKGIMLYNESDYDSAILAFREARNRVEESRMIAEKSYWYLGNALINVGQFEAAREAVLEAYQLDGVFRNQAFRLLQRLNDELDVPDDKTFDTE